MFRRFLPNPKAFIGCFIVALALSQTRSGAQALTVTDGLQLWLKADAGVTTDGDSVTSWADQSSSPDAATQVAVAIDPTYAPKLVANALNGKPILRFDGEDDYLSIPDTESLSFIGDLTTFFVVKFDDFATYRAVWAKTDNNLPAPTDFYTLPGTGIPRVYRGDGTSTTLGSFDGGSALTAGAYLTVGFSMEGTTCTHYVASQETSHGIIDVLEGDTDRELFIGTRGDYFTKMKGDIAEIVIYNRALTAAEREAVVSYLGNKYGIANLLPTANLVVAPPGPNHAAGDIVTLTATANDADGTVANVKFFANGALLGTASAPPYRIRVKLDTAGSYAFTARATDNKNATGDSTAIARTATGGTPPPLGVTSTLQLWFKADAGVTTGGGGAVTEWQDQSGKANHAIAVDEATAPALAAGAINSLPAIRFDGVDDSLQVPDSEGVSFAGDVTSFFVVKMDDFGTYRSVWAKTAGGGGNLPAPTDFYTLPGSGIPQVYRGDGTFDNLAASQGSSALRAGSFDLVGFSASGATVSHFLNGAPNGSGNTTAGTADGDNPLFIGSRTDGVTRLKGDLAELLIYDTALSSADLQNVQLYLAGRYGLPLSTAINDSPTVSLTAPAPGGTVVAPADVTLSANANDADGSLVKVEFLINGGIVATDVAAPFSAIVNFPVGVAATIQARATDNLGAVTLSDPVSFTSTSTEPIPLPAVADLRLWLRADKGVTETAGAVSSWNDQSGNFNLTTQADAAKRPVLVANAINGKPALRFDGADDSLAALGSPSLAITGDISSFFVVKFDDFATFRGVWGKTAGGAPATTDFYTVPDSGIPRVYRGNGGGSLGSVDALAAPTAGQYAVIGFDQAGTTLHHYLNRDLNGEGEITAPLADTGAPLYIGTRGDQVTRMKGEIAEIVIYNTALSETDRAALNAYFDQRYAIGVPGAPTLTIVNGGNGSVTISWPVDATGWQLESTLDLSAAQWGPVSGVQNNSVTQNTDSTAKYYRLLAQ